MDSIISMGQKYLSGQSGGGGSSGGSSGGFDFSSLASLASQHDTQNSGDSDLFGNAASFLQNNDQNPDDVDEDEMQQHEQRVNQGGEAHSTEIGNAAAVSSVKNMLSGGGLAGMLGGSSGDSSSSSGGMQQKIISMAMAQAAAMFDQKQANGEVTGGDKQSAVNSAGSAATKLMLKYGAGGNMGVLASKFM